MSSHASTTTKEATPSSDQKLDGPADRSNGTELPPDESPQPGQTGNGPAGTGQPTWTQLQTPPQGAANPRPMPPFPPQLGSGGPLIPGALSARQSPVPMRQLAGLCAWAAAVTLLGVAVGLWVMIRLMTYGTPGWFEPVIVLNGLVGIGLAIAAFLKLDKGNLPWILMGGSTLVLFLSIGITATAG